MEKELAKFIHGAVLADQEKPQGNRIKSHAPDIAAEHQAQMPGPPQQPTFYEKPGWRPRSSVVPSSLAIWPRSRSVASPLGDARKLRQHALPLSLLPHEDIRRPFQFAEGMPLEFPLGCRL